jgi:hypothetical protein
MFKIILYGILNVKIYGLNIHPSHFRIIPLNFYTTDNRNDIFFEDLNYYGVRIGWIGSHPPDNNIIVNNDINCINLKWEKSGMFNPHKNKWDNLQWEYSFIDTKLYTGYNKINIGQYTYNVNIPKVGFGNDATLIIGDPNIAQISSYALGNADIVIKNTLLNLENKASFVIWLGDIFYHDGPESITTELPKLINNNNNVISGFTSYLHVGIQGNHDYSSNTACHNCNWNINKNGLLCVNNNEVSGSWVNYLMISDGLKSFDNELSNIYHRGCRVPYEYTLQIKVIGKTGFIIIDNTWHYNEININWNAVSSKLNQYTDTILILGHWDMIHSGSKASITEWVNFLKQFFNNKRIYGVQGHTHINKISDNIVTVGGNGFRGSGCDCSHTCMGCHCCCPTLYNNSNFILGGWDIMQLCSPHILKK